MIIFPAGSCLARIIATPSTLADLGVGRCLASARRCAEVSHDGGTFCQSLVTLRRLVVTAQENGLAPCAARPGAARAPRALAPSRPHASG